MMEKRDHISEAIEAIDRGLNRPIVTIEEALQEGVAKGNLTILEAEQCREAYYRTLYLLDGSQLDG